MSTMAVVKSCTKWFHQMYEGKRYEKQEKIKDILYDTYYAQYALVHLNNVIMSFGRRPQRSLKRAMSYARSIGILQPYADDIKYMQNMKKVSLIIDGF